MARSIPSLLAPQDIWQVVGPYYGAFAPRGFLGGGALDNLVKYKQ